MTSMDKVASLRAFVKVVETGSFAEAGRQLRLSRSAISKYVAELEQSLGVQLLNRTTRHASPNESGQIYFERALTILSEIDAADEAVAHAQSSPSGLLRINAPMSFGTIQLGPAIPELPSTAAMDVRAVRPVSNASPMLSSKTSMMPTYSRRPSSTYIRPMSLSGKKPA
jgi:DNA-binding transcriptional LysR family regulator